MNTIFRPPTLFGFLLLLLAALLTACGGKKDGDDSSETSSNGDPAPGNAESLAAAVQAFYEAEPEFFRFLTPADLPAGLDWKDGSEQSELGSPEAIKGGTFNSFISDFPRTLRLVGPDASSGFRGYILDDNGGPGGMSLTSRHPDTLEPIPCLARQWAIDADGQTVYFKLDPDAQYSDGKPVTVEDYFFAFYFMRSPHIKAPWYNDYYQKKFQFIARYDAETIAVSYSEAKPDLVYRAGGFRPIAQHFYAEFGEDFLKRYNYRFEPTTGPYEVLEKNMNKGRSVTLTKVPDWWAADKPFQRYRYNVDTIYLQVIREPSKTLELFKKGDLDVHGLGLPEYWYQKIPNDLPEVQKGFIEKVTFYNEIPGPDWALRINQSRPPFNNRDLRIGINYAMNWDLVIEQIFYGDYQRMETAADNYGPFSHPSLQARRFDPAKAGEYFAKAGYDQMGPDGILRNAQGQRLQATVTTGYKQLTDVLTVLQQEARKAGLDLQLEILEQTAAWKKADEKKHEINFSALNRSVEMYPRFWEMFHSYHAFEADGSVKTDTNNDTATAIPELDVLIDQYRFSSDKDEMMTLSHQILEMLHEDAAYIPGWKTPWSRIGKWRWVRFPPGYFDHRTARDSYETAVFWIDPAMKEETLEARRTGKTFPPVIEEYDPFGLKISEPE